MMVFNRINRFRASKITLPILIRRKQMKEGRHLGWWESNIHEEGYSAQEFFDTYFLTPPYPSFLEVILTGRFKWRTQRVKDWYDNLLRLADWYPNIEIAFMLGTYTTDKTLNDPNHEFWTDFENFIIDLKVHPSAFSFGLMWEYIEPDSWDVVMNAYEITKRHNVRFVSYRGAYEIMEGNEEIDGIYDIGITNFPYDNSMYAALDRHTGFFYIGQTAGYWFNNPFPNTTPCPEDRTQEGNFGWQKCVIDLIIEHAVEKTEKVRHAVTLCTGGSTTEFVGVSGKTTNRIWDSPLIRQWIWENPLYEPNFILANGSVGLRGLFRG